MFTVTAECSGRDDVAPASVCFALTGFFSLQVLGKLQMMGVAGVVDEGQRDDISFSSKCATASCVVSNK